MMYKKTLAAVFTVFLMMVWPGQVDAAAIFTISSTAYITNGSEQSMDMAPYIANGRTYLPVRFAAEAVGVSPGAIGWNPATGQVNIANGGQSIMMTVGSQILAINGAAIRMDTAPEIVGGRMMLPVRFLAQALGVNVIWNPVTQTMAIGETLTPVNTQSDSLTTVPDLRYDPSIQTTARDLSWQYRGDTYTWHVETPSDLLAWDRQVYQLTGEYYSGQYSQDSLFDSDPSVVQDMVVADSVQDGGDLATWVTEAFNSQWAGYLADRLANCASSNGFDYFHTAEFIQSFVCGAITYQSTDVPELPVQTIVDNGDCKDKSILLAALLQSLSYKVALLQFAPGPGETSGHMAVGVAFSNNQIPQNETLSYYLHNGLKYYFAETTVPGWTLGTASDREPANVYDVN